MTADMTQDGAAALLGRQEVEAMLVKGIQDQRVAVVAREILGQLNGSCPEGAHNLAHAAEQACTAISAQMVAIRTELVQALNQKGIAAEAVAGPEDQGELQYHLSTIEIDSGELIRALPVLEAQRFRPPVALNEGRASIIAKTARELRFTRFDEASPRIVLRFSNSRTAGRLSAFHPRTSDLGMMDLPNGLSALYWPLRLIRVAAARGLGRHSGVSENDLLGTPQSLIGSILDRLHLGEGDLLVDLGCGDGRIVAAVLARGCRAKGYELDPALAAVARSRCEAAAPKNGVEAIIHGNAETADLSGATVVFLFAPRHLWKRLLPKLQGQVAPAARIVAHEQNRIPWQRPADVVVPIFANDAMTVLHIWQSGAT